MVSGLQRTVNSDSYPVNLGKDYQSYSLNKWFPKIDCAISTPN